MSTKTGPMCCTLKRGSPGTWLPMPLVQGRGNFAAIDFQRSTKHGWMLLSMPGGVGLQGCSQIIPRLWIPDTLRGESEGWRRPSHLARQTAPDCPVSVWGNSPGSHWSSTMYLLLYTCNSNVETEVSLGQKYACCLEDKKVVEVGIRQ